MGQHCLIPASCVQLRPAEPPSSRPPTWEGQCRQDNTTGRLADGSPRTMGVGKPAFSSTARAAPLQVQASSACATEQITAKTVVPPAVQMHPMSPPIRVSPRPERERLAPSCGSIDPCSKPLRAPSYLSDRNTSSNAHACVRSHALIFSLATVAMHGFRSTKHWGNHLCTDRSACGRDALARTAAGSGGWRLDMGGANHE